MSSATTASSSSATSTAATSISVSSSSTSGSSPSSSAAAFAAFFACFGAFSFSPRLTLAAGASAAPFALAIFFASGAGFFSCLAFFASPL